MGNTLNVNGNQREFSAGEMPSTVQQRLDALHINNATVVAEIDGVIVERKDFDGTIVKAGQAIELVRFIGGG